MKIDKEAVIRTLDEPLTRDQQIIFDIAEGTNDCILIHGKPGVGKSVLVRTLDELGKKPYTRGAPTGLAAVNILGKTLNSIFGIPISKGILAPDFNNFPSNPNVQRYITHGVKVLIIDEISMVRSDTLDWIDRCLKHFKGNDLPFGGIQVIAVGDFFQLPPIVNREDKEALKNAGWKSEFAFDAHCFSSFRCVVLDEVLRQKDKKFIDILHLARTGDIGPKEIALLNKRVEPCKDFRVRLTARNDQADQVNQSHLEDLPGEIVEYHATAIGNWKEFPAPTILSLKVGAQVIVKKNGADRPPGTRGKGDSTVVNGDIGIVRELHKPTTTREDEEENPPKVMVELKNGRIIPVYVGRWEEKIKERGVDGKWTERIVASFTQIPLQLAWAISMHKSQGQSFESVHINPRSVFAAGQLYVALSRARSLAGMSLECPIVQNAQARIGFFANWRVIQFVERIEEESERIKKEYRKKIAA